MDSRDKKTAEASAVVIRHGEMPNLILHGKRKDSGKWIVPGGHVHAGEDIKEAAVRETKEETGLELSPDDLEYVGKKHYGDQEDKQLTVHLFLCKKTCDNKKMDHTGDKDQEFSELKFIDPLNHDDLYQPNGESILVTYLKGNLNKPETKKSEELLEKGAKELKAMYGPNIQPHQQEFVKWATSKLPNGNWQEWAVKNHIKDPNQFTEESFKNIERFANAKHVPDVANVRFDKHNIAQGLELFENAENNYAIKSLSSKKIIIPDKKTTKLMDVGDNFSWYSLNVENCEAEAEAMGHCGNRNTDYDEQNLLSLRRNIKVGDKEYHEPVVTFVVGGDNKSIGQMKGKGNLAPSKKYHKYIKQLFEKTNFLPVGSQHLEGNDFSLDDLSQEEHDDLISKRPDLIQYSSRVSPEIQEKLSETNDTPILYKLLKNPKLHPKAQEKIFQKNKNSEFVISRLVQNPNLSFDIQKKIINSLSEKDFNFETEKGFYIENLAQNKNLHPEIQNVLSKLKDFYILKNLASNENLTMQAQNNLLMINPDDTTRAWAGTSKSYKMHNVILVLKKLYENKNVNEEIKQKIQSRLINDFGVSASVPKKNKESLVYESSKNNLKAREQRIKEYFDKLESPTKKSEELDKGSLQRRFKFDPQKDVSEQEAAHLRLWQTYGNDGHYGETVDDIEDVKSVREGLKPINPNAKKRGLSRLMSMTKTRFNPETKEREFLLHRGVSNDEHKNSVNVKNNLVQHNDKTSWMPDYDTAVKYGNPNYSTSGRIPDSKEKGKVISAWIGESKIHHMPKMYGAIGSPVSEGANEYQEENEIIVLPHKSILVNFKEIKNKLSQKNKILHEKLKSNYVRNVLKQNPKPKKLAASEKSEDTDMSSLTKTNKPKKAKNLRRFYLNRKNDVNGVSGEGIVAVGVQFPNGKCVLNWVTDTPSFNFYNSINDIKDIHGHGDSTEIHFMDDLNKSEKEKKLQKAYENKRLKWKYLRKFPEHKLPFMFLKSRIK